MPVIEREETRAKTELGAAQKDTARELGAKLASLRGIVWIGLALFVFGLASFVLSAAETLDWQRHNERGGHCRRSGFDGSADVGRRE